MLCPSFNNKICGGHGRCISQGQAASDNDVLYSDWDAEQIFGCICDEGYAGYNCGQRQCVLGNDPYDGGQLEIQTVRTTITHQYEEQVVTLGGPDTNQVQTLHIEDADRFVPFTGQFRLTLDTTDTTKCLACVVRTV